jgi:NADH-quinone oxidoreductase subunit E
MVQKEEGCISEDSMREIAEIVGVTPAEVYEVISFYTMFHSRPVGRHLICVCDTLSCAICGAFEVGKYIQQKLGIKLGETTGDGRYTLEYVECIGACTEAPAMLVDEDLHGSSPPRRRRNPGAVSVTNGSVASGAAIESARGRTVASESP